MLLLPIYLNLLLVLRDLPCLLPVAKALRALVSLALSIVVVLGLSSAIRLFVSFITAAPMAFKIFPAPSSHDLGLTFLPDSSKWAIGFALLGFYLGVVRYSRSHERAMKVPFIAISVAEVCLVEFIRYKQEVIYCYPLGAPQSHHSAPFLITRSDFGDWNHHDGPVLFGKRSG